MTTQANFRPERMSHYLALGRQARAEAFGEMARAVARALRSRPERPAAERHCPAA